MGIQRASLTDTIRRVFKQWEYGGQRQAACVLSNGVKVVGQIDDPVEGCTYRFWGAWEDSAKYGKQFSVDRSEQVVRDKYEGVMKVLTNTSTGIGKKRALMLVDAYGDDIFDAVVESPEQVSKLSGVPVGYIKRLAMLLMTDLSDAADRARLTQLFAGTPVGGSKIGHIVESREGHPHHRCLFSGCPSVKAMVESIRKDPFCLTHISGVGFKASDSLRAGLGLPADSDSRYRAAMLHVLHGARARGDTAMALQPLARALDDALGGYEKDRLVRVGQTMLDSAEIDTVGDSAFCLQGSMSTARRIMAEIRRLQAEPAQRILPLNTGTGASLDQDQIRAFEMVSDSTVSTITGPPGSGKSYLIAAIADACKASGVSVHLCAFTGRAARRIEELSGHKAVTIHRLLESDHTGIFTREEPIRGVVIIDEVSTVDAWLFSQILRYLDSGTRLVLVGDHHQLPSVGPGAVMRDLLNTDIPRVELVDIKRQAKRSQVVKLCRDIIDSSFDFTSTRDFSFIECPDSTAILESITEDFLSLYRAGNRRVQIICPFNTRTQPVSTAHINNIIADSIHGYESNELRDGDRVIQNTNDYERGIMNGDIGLYRDGKVSFGDRTIDIDLTDVSLAYAITCHKFQGSEENRVLVALPRGSSYSAGGREWLYTAISRGKIDTRLYSTRDEVMANVRAVKSEDRLTVLSMLSSVG